MAETVYSKVKKIADEYGIPEWVWAPIMAEESGGDPNNWNDPSKNGGREDSRGLFQINIMANPQYANKDLFDPEVNARIAFSDFIGPAWQTAKNKSDLTYYQKTAYVWKEGIRPQWTEEKRVSVEQKAKDVFADGLGWSNKLSSGIGDWLTNATRYILGRGKATTVEQDRDAAKQAEIDKAKQKDAGGGTVDGGDKITILKNSWLTPEISFSKSGFLNKTVTVILFIIGAILLIAVLKSMFLQSQGGEPVGN